MRDHYATLGVSKTASPEEIKKAYHVLAMKFHPDRNKGRGAEDRFKEINEAYQVLSDPEKRREYEWQSNNPSRNPTWSRDDESYYQSRKPRQDYDPYEEYARAHRGEPYTSARDYAGQSTKHKSKPKTPPKPSGTSAEFNEFRGSVVKDYESIFDMFFGKNHVKPNFINFKRKKP